VVLEVNEKLEAAPELVNKSPYDEGWLFKLKPHDIEDVDDLLDSNGYEEAIGASE
jgi:glycine cleavage system H protein